jgi:hypothetical protein
MRKKKDTMGEWIIGLIIGGLMLFFLLRSQKQEEERILNNGEFSIGEVTFYSSSKPGFIIPRGGGSTPKPTNVFFYYKVNDSIYEMRYSSGPGIKYIPDTGIYEGQKYLVIYDKKNPNKSRMLFKYPIRDSGDFERYVKDLKNNPEKLRNYRE